MVGVVLTCTATVGCAAFAAAASLFCNSVKNFAFLDGAVRLGEAALATVLRAAGRVEMYLVIDWLRSSWRHDLPLMWSGFVDKFRCLVRLAV